MSSITRLAAGSAGLAAMEEINPWNADAKRINMFKINGLYPMFPRLNSPVRGYILPSFDLSLDDNDESRPLSVTPYRDAGVTDPKTYMPAFTGWFVGVKGYTYFGKNGSTFVSPIQNRKPDPIIMLRDEIKRRVELGETSLAPLVSNGKTMKERAYLPGVSGLVLMNVWSTNTNDKAKDAAICKNRVLVLKATAYSKLLKDLDELHPGGISAPRDPNWPMFLRGDITNPANALEWGICSHTAENGFTGAALELGRVAMNGTAMTFQGRSSALPMEALAGRYDIGNFVTTLHIPEPEEVIDLLVHEDVVPYDIICDVCGHLVDQMPPRKSGAKSASAAPAAYQPSAPQQPVYPPQPQQQAYQPQQPVYQQPQQSVYQQTQQPVYPQQPVYQQSQQQVYQPQPQQPVYQQPQQPVYPQQPQQPVYQQPAVSQSPLMQEDPDDDIPYGDAPSPAPAPAPAQKTGNLTPEEAEELKRLTEGLMGTGSLSIDELKRLKELRNK